MIPVRVALDLDGALESFGDSGDALADALDTLGIDLVRLRTSGVAGPGERVAPGRTLWGPWWRRSWGRSLDVLLGGVDVVHVTGLAVPPTRDARLLVSLDDLRPLRSGPRSASRVAPLRRAVQRGAVIAVSSHVAAREVREALTLGRDQVRVAAPAVVAAAAPTRPVDLVVNVTGVVETFRTMVPTLSSLATRRGGRLVAIVSAAAAGHLRGVPGVVIEPRPAARRVLAGARLALHLSDGARFPSFAIAALGAGVPTVARATAVNRELLEGAARLVDDDVAVVTALDEMWDEGPARSLARAAGRTRAADFTPDAAARGYASLYREMVGG